MHVRLKKQRVNRIEGNVSKPKLIQHAFDKCQMAGYKQARVLQLYVVPDSGNTRKPLMCCILIITFQLIGKELNYEMG